MEPNKNGRIYPKEVMELALKEFKEKARKIRVRFLREQKLKRILKDGTN